MLPHLALTTDPGLEDLALEELQLLADNAGISPPSGLLRPLGLAGHLHVWIEAPSEVRLQLVRQMRSIHKVVRPVDTFELPETDALQAIRERVARICREIPELVLPDQKFRARCSRVGTHTFTSEMVERIAGAGVRDVLPRAVDLKNPDVILRCDVRDRSCQIGVQQPGPALSKRDRGPFRPSVTLRPSLAWGLIHLACPHTPPQRLLDPFAGAGTILLEAAARWPALRLYGSDILASQVEGLRSNLSYADLLDRAEIRLGDARNLDSLWPETLFDTIVTNPPFGRRLSQKINLEALYWAFLDSLARQSTPDARLVVLVEDRIAFNHALQRSGKWQTLHVRIVEMGGVYVGVFLCTRTLDKFSAGAMMKEEGLHAG